MVGALYVYLDVVAELTRRWLREVPDDRLRTLLEAATTVRRFDQYLLDAAFFHADEEGDTGLYVVPASPADLADLQAA